MEKLPPRFARDLETAIVWLKEAAEKLAEIENHDDSTHSIRELASDARTSVKSGLYLFREVRSSNEDLNHAAEITEEKETNG